MTLYIYNVYIVMYVHGIYGILVTPRAHAQSGVKQLVLSVCPSISLKIFGLITTTKGLNTSGHHSNNYNSEKLVHHVPVGG